MVQVRTTATTQTFVRPGAYRERTGSVPGAKRSRTELLLRTAQAWKQRDAHTNLVTM